MGHSHGFFARKGLPQAGLCLSSAAPTLPQFQRPVHDRLGQRQRKPGLREVGAEPPLPTATLRRYTRPAPALPAGPVSRSPMMPPTPLALLPFHRWKRGSPEAALAPGHRPGERDPKTLARRASLPPELLAMTGLRVESRGPGSRATVHLLRGPLPWPEAGAVHPHHHHQEDAALGGGGVLVPLVSPCEL